MKLRKCKHCGCKMSAGNKFCPQCGAPSTRSPSKLPLMIAVFLVLIAVAIAAILYRAKSASALPAPSMEETQIQAGSGTLYVPDTASFAADEETGVFYVNDLVLVFFSPDATQEQINQAIAATGGTVVGSLPIIHQYQIQIAASSLPEIRNLCETLNGMDGVVQAIYDEAFAVSAQSEPDDPWENNFWSHIPGKPDWSNPDDDRIWWAQAVDAAAAWDYNDQLSPIQIGIIDKGFDTNHEDLKDKIAFVNDTNLADDHGTRCAGIIGAQANNGIGITGLVDKCTLYLWDYKTTGRQVELAGKGGVTLTDSNMVLGGTVSLIEKGCKVINASCGQSDRLNCKVAKDGTITFMDDKGNPQTPEELLSAALQGSGLATTLYLLPLLEQGKDFVIVQAAGNGDKHNISVDARLSGYFAAVDPQNGFALGTHSVQDLYDRIIVVGGAENLKNRTFQQRDSSNAGERVDICAPGVKIFSTEANNRYDYDNGTSSAAPIVSGIAAMTWAANPDLTGSEVKQILCSTENTRYSVPADTNTKHPFDNTYRMVNAKLCVEAALESRTASDGTAAQAGTGAEEEAPSALLLTKSVYTSDMTLRSETRYEYSQDGILSSSTERRDSGRIDATEIYTTVCRYDANGNCLEEKEYYNDEDTPSSQVTRTFDEYGNPVQENYSGEIAFGGQFTYEYTYDAAGRIENAKCYNNGDLYTDTSYTYLENGHTEESFCYLIAYSHTVTTYDQNGDVTKSVNYMDDGTTQETLYTYEYDEFGNKTREVVNELAFQSTGETTWSYTYDDNGNVTQCQEFHDGSLFSVTKYTYKLPDDASGQTDTDTPEQSSSSSAVLDLAYLQKCARYQGHFYKIEGVTLTWSAAKIMCESLGGHLATITSQTEQELIQSLNADNRRLWIGGQQDADGNWCWITGEPWDYTNWGDGEPNNSGNVVAGESCVALWPQTWNDLADENVYEQEGYVFEWEATAIPEAYWGDISAFVGEYDNPDATDMNSTYSISIQSDGTWSWSGNRSQISGISYERDGTLYLLASSAKSWSNIDDSGWSDHATQAQGSCTLQGDKLTLLWQPGGDDKDGLQEVMYRK